MEAVELFEHPLFHGADQDALRRLLATLRPQLVRRGGRLTTLGAESVLVLVLRGRLRTYQLTPDGRELLLELIEPGGFDDILAARAQEGHFTDAEQDSTVVLVPLSLLEKVLLSEPRVALNLLRLMHERLHSREYHLEAMALHDPSRRLARQLLALGQTLGEEVDGWVVLSPRLTHQMLADMLGIRRETVTLHLHQLTAMGAVRVDGGHFHLNRHRLRQVITLVR